MWDMWLGKYGNICLYNSFYLLESCSVLVYFLFGFFFLTRRENGNVEKSQWTITYLLANSFVHMPQLHVAHTFTYIPPQGQLKLHYGFHPVFSLHRSAVTRGCGSLINDSQWRGGSGGEANPAFHLLSKLLVCRKLTFLKLHPHFGDLSRLAAECLNSWVPIYCTLPTLHWVSVWALWQMHKHKKRRIQHGGSVSIITTFCSSPLCWCYRTASG